MTWQGLLQKALKANKKLPTAKYVQLATVRPCGRPSCRTIVFRGFLDDSDDLIFCTDTRASKIEDFAHSPAAALCWYFSNSRDQFRIEGNMTVVDAACSDGKLAAARQALWERMSDPGRTQFAWPHPGQEADDNIDKTLDDTPTPPAEQPALDTFALLVLSVEHVDYLSLKRNERSEWRRAEAGSDEAWHQTQLNP